MSEEERMTNRELAKLCAKGLVEWRREKDYTVRHAYEYEDGLANQPVDDDIAIRPFDTSRIKSDHELEWFAATKQSYLTLTGIEGLRALSFL